VASFLIESACNGLSTKRWSWFPGQNGGLAKVDSGFGYAAALTSNIVFFMIIFHAAVGFGCLFDCRNKRNVWCPTLLIYIKAACRQSE